MHTHTHILSLFLPPSLTHTLSLLSLHTHRSSSERHGTSVVPTSLVATAVTNLGEERQLTALSLLGKVDSFAPARATLECAPGPSGPWRRVSRFRALGEMAWQRVDLEGPATTRFCRVFIRREGHATFRHAVHGVVFHTE